MPVLSDYRDAVRGAWRLVYFTELWNSDVERHVLELVAAQPWAKHPQTLPLRVVLGARERELHLKVFHAGGGIASVKDALRQSKALRGWRIAIDLAEAGFAAPLTIAAGEQRRAGLLRRAFILTENIAGLPAHRFLYERMKRANSSGNLAYKRAGLRQAASLIRRFHGAGFVHGDLVATNLFVAEDGRNLKFYFMDNDRTRRYPMWLRQPLWKRNLVQLNRMALPGITLQDRMRFFKAYFDVEKIGSSERAFARWLERRTRQRRRECDGVGGSGSFRRLMRWSDDGRAPARTK